MSMNALLQVRITNQLLGKIKRFAWQKGINVPEAVRYLLIKGMDDEDINTSVLQKISK
jgi:antitoxin component of RelBE/YafQ-DinJ toxin-antitoxin module